MFLKKCFYLLLNFFFPPICAGCKKEGQILCADCEKKIKIQKVQVCPICKSKITGGFVCDSCSSSTSLSSLFVSAPYDENRILKNLLKRLKYKFSLENSEVLGDLLVKTIEKNFKELKSKNIVITFVPLYKKRQAWRGFNQAEILADQVSQKTGIRLSNLLVRKKDTLPQFNLSREKRLKNLLDAFDIKKKGKGEDILIIDDIAGTLSTLENCAKELRKNNYGNVYTAVVSRN